MIRLNAPSKITNLDDVAIFDQNVLWFDISMDQTLFVQVVYSGTDLNEEVKGCILTQVFFFPNEVKQVTFGGVLKCQINSRFVFKTCV